MTTTIEKCPTCGADAVHRSEWWEAAPDNGQELQLKLHSIKKTIIKYYLALDRREHGGVAQDKAFNEMQQILGMHWEQGKMTQFLEDHPKLKPLYDGKEVSK